MKIRLARPSLALLLGLGLLTGCQVQTDNAKTSAGTSSTASTPASPAVATVNGKTITEADLTAYRMLRAGQMPNVDLSNKALVQELVDMRLLEQAAVKEGMADKPQIKAQIDQNRANILIQALLREKFGAQKYSDAELKKQYDQLVSQASQREYKARHILLKTEAEAKKVIEQLNKGANFAELAKKDSIAPSAPKGGELGWFTAQTMVAPFSQAVEKLKKGEYTKTPVHTRFGWHVILLQDTRKMNPPPFDQVKSRIRAMLTQQAIQKYVTDLRDKADIKIDAPAVPPANTTGSTPPAVSKDTTK
ncbi:MAG: peptidylprolyl isomerase [Acidihalobacter sp.]|jgi:peptidyl-prolyl cis-trans isomerase C